MLKAQSCCLAAQRKQIAFRVSWALVALSKPRTARKLCGAQLECHAFGRQKGWTISSRLVRCVQAARMRIQRRLRRLPAGTNLSSRFPGRTPNACHGSPHFVQHKMISERSLSSYISCTSMSNRFRFEKTINMDIQDEQDQNWKHMTSIRLPSFLNPEP
jgi:hypothetical protein